MKKLAIDRIARTAMCSSALCLGLVIPALAENSEPTEKPTMQSAKEQASDTWLEAKLATTFTFTDDLSVFDIDTEVRNGTAYLSGVVESEVQKDLAEEIALSVEGIRDVENKLEVNEQTAAERREAKSKEHAEHRSFGQVVEDLSTTARIKTKLLANSNTPGLGINVTTKNGMVTLQGKVDSEEKKALVEQMAENVEGVRSVDSELTVASAS